MGLHIHVPKPGDIAKKAQHEFEKAVRPMADGIKKEIRSVGQKVAKEGRDAITHIKDDGWSKLSQICNEKVNWLKSEAHKAEQGINQLKHDAENVVHEVEAKGQSFVHDIESAGKDAVHDIESAGKDLAATMEALPDEAKEIALDVMRDIAKDAAKDSLDMAQKICRWAEKGGAHPIIGWSFSVCGVGFSVDDLLLYVAHIDKWVEEGAPQEKHGIIELVKDFAPDSVSVDIGFNLLGFEQVGANTSFNVDVGSFLDSADVLLEHLD